MTETARLSGVAERQPARPSSAWDLWRIFWPWTLPAESDRVAPRPSGFVPHFDVRQTEDLFTLKADLPGVQEDDLEVTVAGKELTVSGARQEEPSSGTEKRYVAERGTGAFKRSFVVPEGFDASEVDAELKDGVLTLELHRRAEAKNRKIEIRSEHAGEAPESPHVESKEGNGGPKPTKDDVRAKRAGFVKSPRRSRARPLPRPR